MTGEKTAWTLITGAAKGLGKTIALELAKQKIPVVIQYNTHKDLAEEVAHLCSRTAPAEIIQGDFEDIVSFAERYKKQFPRTKHLINDVGNFLVAKCLELSLDDVQSLFQTNFFAPYVLCQQLVQSIIREKGSIINIGSSGLLSGRGFGYAPLYTISKLSLLSLTKSLAKELAEHGVRVNMVSPGKLENSIDLHSGVQPPMKRFGTLEEVSCMVSYLLDEKSSYITGQNIEIAGGLGL
jgi:NAD(P)-dependent dehydrogenase (short-subunit alcohol dehydrogenase family)